MDIDTIRKLGIYRKLYIPPDVKNILINHISNIKNNIKILDYKSKILINIKIKKESLIYTISLHYIDTHTYSTIISEINLLQNTRKKYSSKLSLKNKEIYIPIPYWMNK